jgi:hypothetical protein
MATYRVTYNLTGYINGQLWPAVGEEIDLGDADVSGMVEAGHLEVVKPAKKKAAKKPDDSEKRPASQAKTETRKKS